jgi:hypothetical protein
MSSGEAPQELSANWVVRRPLEVILPLPTATRWEVTRRHPYYLRHWSLASQHFRQPSSDPVQLQEEQVAVLMLQVLGIDRDAPAPELGPDQLGDAAMGQNWQGGAIAPLTNFAMAAHFLLRLPPEDRQTLGRFLAESAAVDTKDPYALYALLAQLDRLSIPTLRTAIAPFFFSLNIQAPIAAITTAVEANARRLKEEHGVAEHRRRDDKHDDYLRVWDLREGWIGGEYDVSKELTLKRIGRQLEVSESTVVNRYRSAFRLIVGWPFTPELWAQVIGSHKLKFIAKSNTGNLPFRTLRRRWTAPTTKPVSETTLSGRFADEAGEPLLNTFCATSDDLALTDLLLDIQELLSKGRSDEDIAGELDIASPHGTNLIRYLRDRQLEIV